MRHRCFCSIERKSDFVKAKTAITLLLFFLAVFAYFFINLGKLLDISQPPERADVIAVLGGDWEGFRIKKALFLYQKGYAGKIILNTSSRIDMSDNGKTFKTETEYLLFNDVPKSRILYLVNAGNTMYELRALKKLALENGFKKLLIVSAPPHLRRVRILADQAADFPQVGLSLILIGSDPPWWHKEGWYRDKASRNFVLAEVIKIVSNYTAYVVLQKHGLLEPVRRYFGPAIDLLKNFFQAQLRRLGNE